MTIIDTSTIITIHINTKRKQL